MRSKSKKGEVSTSPFFLENIKIEKLVTGGAGMGRASDGRVVFVPETCPGDTVRVKVLKEKKNFLEGELDLVVEPSPHRIVPACPVASSCGGCSWQHVSHEEQLRQKQMIVTDILKKFLRLSHLSVEPIIASPKTWRYRNRIQPKIKNGKFGFFKKNSHQIVETDDCLITEERLTSHFAEIKGQFQNTHEPKTIEVYLTPNMEVQWQPIQEQSDGIGFSQVNRFQNENLIAEVIGFAQQHNYRNIWDLYAGSGNFTFPLQASKPEAEIIAVELSSKLVQRGKESSKTTKKLDFVCSDVEKFLLGSKNLITAEDLVVLDPPRAGCSPAVMTSLAHKHPKHLIYISCHPVSLARDLALLIQECEKINKRVQFLKIQPFEMFPHTDHLETIVFLSVDT
ncbi:MAG: class I SAM-dependent RNA methyltransferase [Bdellovibrionia bacterium]